MGERASGQSWAVLTTKYISITVNMPSKVGYHAGCRGLDTRVWLAENHMQNGAIRDEINHPLPLPDRRLWF